MDHHNLLEERFEANRTHLRAVAYRMLGSLSDADDALQEAWIRARRADAAEVENVGGWLTTIVARVCLNVLRSRRSHPVDPLDAQVPGPAATTADGSDPEQEAVLADSVGLALLVVLETLPPAERLAFVLHDMFAMPFEEISTIVGRTPTAARQLASRARRRVQGTPAVPEPDLARQRRVVEAFLAASRGGDFDALVAVLDPDVVLRADGAQAREVRGALAVAGQAASFSNRSPFSRAALVNGTVGIIVAPRGRLLVASTFTIADDRIVAIEIITDPDRLRRLDLAVLDN